MNPENQKLLYAIAFFLGCLGALQFGEPDGTWQFIWFIVWIFIALPVLLLRLFEAASVWRQSHCVIGRLFGWIFGAFHFLFALTMLGIGVSIILWILYNLLIERQPEFKGHWFNLIPGFGLNLTTTPYLFTPIRHIMNRGHINLHGQMCAVCVLKTVVCRNQIVCMCGLWGKKSRLCCQQTQVVVRNFL